MQNGCKVKVREGMSWRAGTLLNADTNLVAVGEPHYSQKVFPSLDIKLFIEMPAEQAAAIHALELPLALKQIEEALAALLPGEKVEVREGSIVGYGGSLTLDPVVIEQNAIGQFVERACWQVTVWKSYPDTRTEPGGVEDYPVGIANIYHRAVQVFIETLFKMKCEDYWESKVDRELGG